MQLQNLEILLSHVRYEVLKAVVMKTTTIWCVTPFSRVDVQRRWMKVQS